MVRGLEQSEMERAGVAKSRQDKISGRPYYIFQYIKRAYKKDGERLFARACSGRTKDNSFKMKEVDLGWI